jgi:integrase
MAFPHPNVARVLAPVEAEEKDKALARFRSWLCARKGLAAGTVALHVGSVRRMVEQLGVFPGDEAIDEYICGLRERVSYSHLCHALVAIERYGEFRGSPIQFDRPTKPKLLIEDTLSEAEISVLLASVKKPRDRALFAVMAYSGIRNAEICALRVEDVDLGAGAVRVRRGKGQRAYAASIAGGCVEVLASFIRERNAAPGDWLFVTERRGNRLQPQDLRKIVRLAAQRAGITRRVHPHLFRHSLAMHLLNRGAHPFTIKEQLGHADLETTLLYLRSEFTRARSEYLLCAPSYV